MSSLSSAMFAGYNKFDNAKVRIGSWREELALKELTGVTRLANPRDKAVFNATGVRVLYHADKPGEKDPGEGKSVSETSFVHPEKVSTTKDRSAYRAPGPRSVLAKQRTRAILASEVAERAALEVEKKNKGDFDTTFKQSYRRYSDEASRSAKQESLKPRPNKPKQGASGPTPETLAVNASDIIASGSEPEFEVGHYSTGKTITLWDAGGMAHGGKHGRGLFGRTSTFTEPGVHPSFFQEVWPDPGPHHKSLPRGLSDLEAASLMFLKRRVLERAQKQPLPSVRGLWRLLWPRTYRDAVGKIGQREFREAMAAFEVPVTQCEVWTVTTAFDNDGSGQICLDKLIHFVRVGGLSEARRNRVRELFRRLDSTNAGEVSLGRILAACDFSRLPAVTKGKTGEGQVAAAFQQHFNINGERAGEKVDMVSTERFQEAFRDIGAACVDTEETCTWEAACPRRHSECKEGVDVDTVGKDKDKDEGDLLFEAVLSSLGGS